MFAIVNLYSNKKDDIKNFLSAYYDTKVDIDDNLKWEKIFDNPVEMAEIIGTFIDNKDNYDVNMWVSLDKGLFINVTEHNVNEIIKYLYERFPY